MRAPFDGVVLIAHGARDARWMEPFHRMRQALADALAPLPVGLSFLDFAPPNFAGATAELYAAGARNLLVLPIFLSGGGHVASDVPELVRAEEARYPDATFTASGAIGEEAEVASGMIQAIVRLATATRA
ncbi:MAG TPA: CbiX/SirB N-terminal domain-containing protein [Polyangiaceae bacterium]|nr:CbiX/SirB N-terminal domain-containing protein [Polyangiaceae bacterium]